MTSFDHRSAARPNADAVLTSIADYVVGGPPASDAAYATARHCLLDAMIKAYEIRAC